MNNPFEVIEARLSSIENLILDLKHSPLRVEPTDHPEQFLTIEEAAEFLDLTVPTVYAKVSRGELPVMKRGKRLYFSRTELMEYIKEGRKKSNAEIEQEAKAYLLNNKKRAEQWKNNHRTARKSFGKGQGKDKHFQGNNQINPDFSDLFNILETLPIIKQDVYKALPDTFETGEGKIIAKKLGMSDRTFGRFLDNKKLFKNIEWGKYEKRYIDGVKEMKNESKRATPQTEKFLTIKEAAKFLDLTVPTVYAKVSRGELPVMKRGKRLYFSDIELVEYLKAGRKKTNAEINS